MNHLYEDFKKKIKLVEEQFSKPIDLINNQDKLKGTMFDFFNQTVPWSVNDTHGHSEQRIIEKFNKLGPHEVVAEIARLEQAIFLHM